MRPLLARAVGRPETLTADTPSTRGGNPRMSSTDQQAGQPAGTDAEVPAEHAVPADLTLAAEFETATRDQWRGRGGGGRRQAGRGAPPPPRAGARGPPGGPRRPPA